VAKDLAKMSSKSAVKLLAPSGDGGLFRWVAWLTGSKNAVKGAGFFLGAALLGLAGFNAAVWGMATLLAVILAAVVFFLPAGLPGRMKSAEGWGGWRSTDPRVNRLSLARMFLFGARDVWFVVGIPVYFQMVLSDGTEAGRREAFFLVGGFMALWIIAYGGVQALAPRLLGARSQPESAIRWAGLLVPIPFALALAALLAGGPAPWLTGTLVAGLLLHGQRRRSAHRHAPVGPELSGGRPAALPCHGGADGAGKLAGRATAGGGLRPRKSPVTTGATG
jgi:hypothetical protein